MASYGAVIEVSVKGQNALEQLESSARKIQSLFNGISAQRNIFDQSVGSAQTRQLKKNLENLVASFAAAKDGARQFKVTVDGQERTVNMYSKTLAGLNSQLNTFNSIANNASVGTNQYATAIQAANKVTGEFLRVQAKALGVATDFSRMNVQSALDLGKTIPSSIDGLNFYKAALENVLGTVKIGSNDFRVLEEAIADVEQRLGSARLAGQVSGIGGAQGPATRLDTVAAYEKRSRYAKQISDLEYKQLLTGQQIVQAKLSENQADDLQNRLAQASDALARGELDVAKRITAELRNQRIAYERKNRAAEALMRPTSMTAGAAESVTGKRPFGQPPVPGSPAALQTASGTQASKQTTQQLGASIDLRKRLNNLTTSAAILEQKIIQYKAKGITVSSDLAEIERAIIAVKDTSTDLDKKKLDYLDLLLNGLRNELLLRKAIAKTQAPSTGKGAAGSKGTSVQQPQVGQGAKTAANVALGAGFPLLFGGGPGAILGGALGGFAPGPLAFAAQIGLSALGQTLDKFGAATVEAGTSIRKLDSAITYMGDKSLFESSNQEYLAKKLEESGRYSIAAAMAQERLNYIIGVEGVNNLQKLGDATDELGRAWAKFTLALQAGAARLLTPVIQGLAEGIEKLNKGQQASSRIKVLSEQLDPKQLEAFSKELAANMKKYGVTEEAFTADELTLKKYEGLAKKRKEINVKLSDEQIAANVESAKALYTELADLERDLNNKKREYAEQYTDMVLALSRQQYDLTEQLQRKAFDTQVEALQKELTLLERQSQIRIEISRNALRGQQLRAAPGADLETNLMTAIEEYRIRREEIDNEAANKERQFKLEMLRLDVENERYKLDIAKTIQRTNYDNAVRIARINEEINRQNDAVGRLNYQRRADIISAELANMRGQTLLLLAEAEASLEFSNLTTDQEAYFKTLKSGLVKALKETSKEQVKKEAGTLFKVPGNLPQMGALPALSMDTSAVDRANVSLQRRIEAYLELENTQGRASAEEAARLDLLAKLDELATTSLGSIIKGQNDQIRQQRLYTAEIETGTITALAEQLTQIEALHEPTQALLAAEIHALEIKKEATGLDREQLDLLNALKDRQERLNEARKTAVALTKQQAEPAVRLQQAITELQGELNNLSDPINFAVNGAKAIGTAFSQAFQGIATGTLTAQEALASFFKSVGEAFVSMAAEIISKQLVMIALQTILKALGAVSGGGTETDAAFMDRTANLDLVGDVKLPSKFASGGFVTSPTSAVVGEGGEPEYIIPASKMRSAMNRYAAGARGSAVIPAGDGGDGGTATMAAAPGAIDVRYTVERINSVDYVTADQFQQGMQRAAQQGAAQGEQRTLRRLQMSTSTRKRLGM